MKAVLIREHGGLDKLNIEEVKKPKPSSSEILVEVKACALNHLDLWTRAGLPNKKFPLPIIPGSDIAGIVREIGDTVAPVSIGDKAVIAPGVSCRKCHYCLNGNETLCKEYGILGESRNGGCAEYISVPVINVIPMPENLTFEEASAIPLVFLTAWHMLVVRAKLKAGEDTLIHSAGSGVGSAAIQIANLLGARVIATVGVDEKIAKAKKLGADYVINYREQDFADVASVLTGKRGVDVIVDHIGMDTWEKNIKSLAKGGRLVACGVTSGHKVSVDMRHIFFNTLSILGSTMGSEGEVLEIMKLVRRNLLKPVVDKVFPFNEIRKAHEYLESRKNFGKVVIKI